MFFIIFDNNFIKLALFSVIWNIRGRLGLTIIILLITYRRISCILFFPRSPSGYVSQIWEHFNITQSIYNYISKPCLDVTVVYTAHGLCLEITKYKNVNITMSRWMRRTNERRHNEWSLHYQHLRIKTCIKPATVGYLTTSSNFFVY